jgi:DNA-binding NtrC family response regulator
MAIRSPLNTCPEDCWNYQGSIPGAGDDASIQFVLPEAGVSLDEAELSFVRQAIQRSGGNQTRAAELLGISRDQLRYRLKKLEEGQVAIADAET